LLSKRIIKTMREADPGREITVKIEKNLTTHADASLMEILLKNLLSNAWKFTAKTKHPVISIGKSSTQGKTVFFIRDNGVGFDPAHSNKLFKPFEHLHGTEYSGSGIGLAIVQRIINRHHGNIWAEGKIDKGATFYFTLGEKPISN
jgi:light-regulated signal transduction histidine kinase (bacteriophytochrome)